MVGNAAAAPPGWHRDCKGCGDAAAEDSRRFPDIRVLQRWCAGIHAQPSHFLLLLAATIPKDDLVVVVVVGPTTRTPREADADAKGDKRITAKVMMAADERGWQ